MIAVQERTGRSTVVANYMQSAPAAAVLEHLGQNAPFTQTAEDIARAIHEPVRAVVRTLNELAGNSRAYRWVPCADGGEMNNYRGLAAVWSLPT